MKRLLSAIVLLLIVIGAVWFLPPLGTVVIAVGVLSVAIVEYVNLAKHAGLEVVSVPLWTSSIGVLGLVAFFPDLLPFGLTVALLFVSSVKLYRGRGNESVLADTAASIFPVIYLSVPIGILIALHLDEGPEGVALLLATVIASDAAQYYGGRNFGRRLLAPRISPKKTVEGAACGIVVGSLVLGFDPVGWLSTFPLELRFFLGAAVAAVGIAGDLFESSLKRASGIKDSSALIPGHGGVLDRIDALVFATPLYFCAVRWLG